MHDVADQLVAETVPAVRAWRINRLHLPFARPRFGTGCAALLSPQERRRESEYATRMIADANQGLLGCATADPTVKHT
jgi:hypothetical protein